jgi:hypothetical protein
MHSWKPQLSNMIQIPIPCAYVLHMVTWRRQHTHTIFWITLAFEKFLGISKLKRGTNQLPVLTLTMIPSLKPYFPLTKPWPDMDGRRRPEFRLLARQRNSKNSVGAEQLMYHVICLQSTCNLPKSFLIPIRRYPKL